MNDLTSELVYMGNKMVQAEHAWKLDSCWFFKKSDCITSANSVGGYEKAIFNGREIFRFVVTNFFD